MSDEMQKPPGRRMTIGQRAVTLRLMAKVAKSERVREMLAETAAELEALAALYNRLYNAAVDMVQRSNGEDPALNIIVTELRQQRGELPWNQPGTATKRP